MEMPFCSVSVGGITIDTCRYLGLFLGGCVPPPVHLPPPACLPFCHRSCLPHLPPFCHCRCLPPAWSPPLYHHLPAWDAVSRRWAVLSGCTMLFDFRFLACRSSLRLLFVLHKFCIPGVGCLFCLGSMGTCLGSTVLTTCRYRCRFCLPQVWCVVGVHRYRCLRAHTPHLQITACYVSPACRYRSASVSCRWSTCSAFSPYRTACLHFVQVPACLPPAGWRALPATEHRATSCTILPFTSLGGGVFSATCRRVPFHHFILPPPSCHSGSMEDTFDLEFLFCRCLPACLRWVLFCIPGDACSVFPVFLPGSFWGSTWVFLPFTWNFLILGYRSLPATRYHHSTDATCTISTILGLPMPAMPTCHQIPGYRSTWVHFTHRCCLRYLHHRYRCHHLEAGVGHSGRDGSHFILLGTIFDVLMIIR